jgi:hypothetical protein
MEALLGILLQFLLDALFIGIFGSPLYPAAKAGRRFWVWVPGLLALAAFVYWRGVAQLATWAIAAVGVVALAVLDRLVARPEAERRKT